MGILTKLIPTRLLFRAAGAQERQATEHERALLLSVPDLVELGYPLEFDPALEHVIFRSFPDGRSELKYTYDPDDANPPGNHIYLVCRAERENDPEQAYRTFDLALKSFAVGARLESAKLSGGPALRSWCSRFFAGHMLNSDGVRTATVVCLQRHRLVFSVLARSIVAETDDDVDDLVYTRSLKAAEWASD